MQLHQFSQTTTIKFYKIQLAKMYVFEFDILSLKKESYRPFMHSRVRIVPLAPELRSTQVMGIKITTRHVVIK